MRRGKHDQNDVDSDPSRRRRGGDFLQRLLRGRAARQGWLAIVEQGIAGGTNFLTMVVIGRWCGADELGLFSLGLTAVFLLVAAQESLITTPYTIFIPRIDPEQRSRVRGSVLLSYLALAAFCVVAMAVVAFVMVALQMPRHANAMVIATAFAAPAWLLRELVRRFAFAELRVGSAVVISSSTMILQTILIVGLIVAGTLSATTGFVAIAIANFAAAGIWLIQKRDQFAFDRRDVPRTVSRHWELGRLMFASQIMFSLGGQSLPWIVASTLGTAATGIFMACDSIIRLANPVVTALTSVLTPRAAQAYADGGSRDLWSVILSTGALIGAFMSLFVLVVAVAGNLLLQLFFGTDYVGHAMLLTLLALARAGVAMSVPPGRGLMVYERADACLKADVACCCVTVVATYLCVHAVGLIGAGLGAAVGSLTLVLINTMYFLRIHHLRSATEWNPSPRSTQGQSESVATGQNPKSAELSP